MIGFIKKYFKLKAAIGLFTIGIVIIIYLIRLVMRQF